jgi:glycosyltransferase involved in cell wall biosynthesis
MTTATEQSVSSRGAGTLTGYSIVYFGNDWSAENRTSSHHLARRLAIRVPLLYVEVPGLRAPKASGRDILKLWRKLKQAFWAPRAVGEQMWCITMPQLPFRHLAFARTINRILGRYLVKRAFRRLRFERTISWFLVPHAGALAGYLSEDLVVYYCIDDYAALPDVDRREVSRMDEELTRRAGQVFVASATLLSRKRELNASAVHSPHGVDIELFSQASEPRLREAKDARSLRHPIIGFFGLIEAWIDLELIAFLAQARPEWTFLLVGRVAVDVGDLAKLPNVVFAGPRPYETLPHWAKAFDVAIIPYRLTEQVLNANPLKLREYLATGKPIVAVSTPEIRQFADHVNIAANREQFLNCIERALVEDSEHDRVRRMSAVASMSWDCRTEEVVAVVERRLAEITKGRDA